MIRLDLRKNIKDLQGKDVEDGSMSILLANALAFSQNSEHALKFWGIAKDLSEQGYRDLDKVDLGLIKNFIKTHGKFSVFAQAQLEEAIEEAEKKANQQQKQQEPAKDGELKDVKTQG